MTQLKMHMQGIKPPYPTWAPHGLTILSSILVVLCFPPWGLWPLSWICFVPWFAAVHRTKNLKEAAIQGFWMSYFFSIGTFYWVAYVLREFGNLPWIVSILGLQIFAVFGQLQFPLYSVLFKWFMEARDATTKNLRIHHSILFLFLMALLYTGVDWLLPKLFMDTLGHSFYKAERLRQVADLGGAFCLTGLAVFVNIAIWQGWMEWKKKQNFQFHLRIAAALLLVIAAWTYGHFRLKAVREIMAESQRGIQAAAIQANIGDFDKVAAEQGIRGAALKIINTFTSLSDEAMSSYPKPDVVIWPETAFPATFRHGHSALEMQIEETVENYVRQIQIPLLFGGYDRVSQRDFNAFFFLSPDGSLQTYRKSILLPFGEYIPGADYFDFIKKAFPTVGFFGKGSGPEVIPLRTSSPTLPEIKISPLICYEALFSDFVIDSARKGSQLILNITNDSWFGEWAEPHLHLALSTFRTVETRVPMLRATNTGISALVLPDGEIVQATELSVPKILNVRVPVTDSIPTLIKLWKDWFGMFALISSVFGLVWMEFGLVSKLAVNLIKRYQKSPHQPKSSTQ